MSKAWIQTYTGKRFDLGEGGPEALPDVVLDVRDLAHHLAMACRYRGACVRFYSVAEHSVRVAHYLLQHGQYLVGDEPGRVDPLEKAARLGRFGLLHDASEAYLGDMSAPFKRLPELAGFCDLEKRLQVRIYRAFGLEGDEPPEVRHADLVLLNTERLELLGPAPDSWGELPPPLREPQGFGWDPTYAEGLFLQTWAALFKTIDEAKP